MTRKSKLEIKINQQQSAEIRPSTAKARRFNSKSKEHNRRIANAKKNRRGSWKYANMKVENAELLDQIEIVTKE